MRRFLPTCLLVLVLSADALPAGLAGPRPLDAAWAEDPDFTIQLQDTWEASEAANRARIEAAYKSDKEDAGSRSKRRQLRYVRLYEGLLARGEGTDEQRIAAMREAARWLSALGCEGRACYRLKGLVDAFPGRPAIAADALREILQLARRGTRTEEGEAWREYAASRLIALVDTGGIGPHHPHLLVAWETRLRADIETCDVWDAARALERVAGLRGHDTDWRQERAELYFLVGRRDRALQLFEDLLAEGSRHPATDRVRRLTRTVSESLRLPSMSSLELNWEGLRQRGVDAPVPALQDLIERGAQQAALVPAGEGTWQSLWLDVDRTLAAGGVPQALRDAHERSARGRLREARRDGRVEGLTEVARLYPWSASVHEALADLGELEVRRGHLGVATAMFQDVLGHTADPRLRARSQAGLLCCGSGAPASTEPLPWMGRSVAPSAIAERLTSPAEPPVAPGALRFFAPPPLPTWPNAVLGRLPEEARCVLPMPAGTLQAGDGRLLYGGPRLLVCTIPGRERPLWTRTTARRGEMPPQGQRRADAPLVIAGPFRPALDGRRVYARWGLAPGGLWPDAVAAFDGDTGRMLWSTRGDAAWDGMVPLGDPVAAEGRVYMMARRGEDATVGRLFLVGLDAERGSTLWLRALGSGSLGLRLADGTPYHLRGSVDLTTHSTPLTVERGAVFCLSHTGVLARCDPRDGMVLWARPYPRVYVGANVARVLRRQGAPPLVAGETVVCVPRDYDGLFAVRRDTGRLLWDRPFVPTEWVSGLAGGLLIVGDSRRVLAVDVKRGIVRWERVFASDVRGTPCVSGESLWVALDDEVARLAVATGLTLESRPARDVRDITVAGNSLVALTESQPTQPPMPDPRAARPLALPLDRTWQLERRGARIWHPSGDRLFAHADGVLECIRIRAEGGVEWRRLLPDGFHDLLGHDDSLVAVYPQHVLALEPATGRTRWQTELPFVTSVHETCGSLLFVGELTGEFCGGVVDLASGRLLWHRRFADALWHEYAAKIEQVAWDGERLHLLSPRFRGKGKAHPGALLVRAEDGRVEGFRSLATDPRDWPHDLKVAGGLAFGSTRSTGVTGIALRDGRTLALHAALQNVAIGKIESLAVQPPWLVLCWRNGYDLPKGRTWVLRTDDPQFLVRRPERGWVRDGVVYDAPERGGLLTATDLATGQAITYQCPPAQDRSKLAGVIGCHVEGDSLWVLSVHAASHLPKDRRLRLDRFDRSTGRHRSLQVLKGILSQGAEAVWGRDVLIVRNEHGLYGLATSTSEPQGRPLYLAYRARPPVAVDGSPEEWAGLPRLPAGAGTLALTHDDSRMYVLVEYPDPVPMVRLGRGEAGAGDWLEMGITTESMATRLGVSVDARGRTVFEAPGSEPLPEGLRARMRHDPATGRTTCEVAVPLASIYRHYGERDRLGLSITVWDDRQDGRDSVPLCRWGEGLEGSVLDPALHQQVHLYPRTVTQDIGLATLVHELPDLPASLEHFRRESALRAGSEDELLSYGWDFIRRHPRSLAAETLLLEMVGRQRAPDAAVAVLRRAAELGVPAPARDRIERMARSVLSQWVHVAEGGAPRSLVLEFCDGLVRTGHDDWGHRAVWGKPPIGWAVPPTEMGDIGLVPQGRWHELRVPLYRVNMHDRPICGINFVQQGGQRVVWDRSAMTADGRETVFLDDAVPPGTTARTWEWVTDPVHSGTKAHANPPPAESYRIVSHTVTGLDEPIVAHLVPPLDRPYLSQWVYLDPARPPESLSIDLHDGRRWHCGGLWGRRTRQERHVGPLPEPGKWYELRLPLAWTPLHNLPITGLAFAVQGGRAVLDRTALVAGDRERVLIDDAAPPAASKSREWLGWRLRPGLSHAGTTTPFAGRRGAGLHCDGQSGYVAVPHAPELDPAKLTLETWVYRSTIPGGSDRRYWLVNKNAHESTEGHYALVVRDAHAGAYLNIGGGDEGRFQAWDEQAALTLGQWHHVTMTYDGAVLRLYVNGAEAANTRVGRARVPGTASLHIGRRQDGYRYFEGMLDEVRLYRRALTPDEVRARFEAAGDDPPAPVQGDCVGYWGFDDSVIAAEPPDRWTWTEQTVRSGRRARVLDAGDGTAGQAVLGLERPVVEHLPFVPDDAAALLQRQLPKLGAADDLWAFFGDLLAIRPDPARRVEAVTWFLQTFPRHPRAWRALNALHAAWSDMGVEGVPGRIAEFLRSHEASAHARYWYHQRHVLRESAFVPAWLVLGPFANPGGQPFGPPHPLDGRAPKLDEQYDGAGGQRVGWQRHEVAREALDFNALLSPNDNVMAYAACRVWSDRPQKVVLAVGSDDDVTVWLNGAQIIRGSNAGYSWPGEFVVDAELRQGWNEVLAKVSESSGEWKLYFELLDPFARAPAQGIRCATEAP